MHKFKSLKNDELIRIIKSGAVGVLPTDTVYGLVTAANNEAAVGRLYKLKHRHKKPGTIIAASVEQLVELGIPRRYLKPVEHFWPGAISIIIPTDMNLGYLHMGKFSLACRIPADEELRVFLEKTGPLLTSSANTPNDDPANTVKEAEAYFKDQVDFYVDGGDLSKNLSSTIIQVVDDAVEVVRPGAVTIDEASGSIVL